MREFAEELVRLKVDIIVAPSSIYTEAAKQATSTIPIIFLSHAEPIGSGHVVSLARPDGNITGIASMMPETTVKALELLTEAIPGLSRVAVIWDPATPSHGPGRNAVEVAGAALKLHLQTLIVRAASEYESAFATISRDRADAVLVLANPLYLASARRLAELAIAHKLASIFTTREFAEAGGLLAYGPDRVDLFRRGAVYVDKILKGAKPADLPWSRPQSIS
jgi:putative ABC transport system substrate-binding protein